MKIQYKETSISIKCDGGFSTNENCIRFNITSNLSDAELLSTLFPNFNFSVINDYTIYSSTIEVSEMWNLIKTIKFEQSDVDKYIYDGIIKWSTNIIYNMNLLKLSLIDWKIV